MNRKCFGMYWLCTCMYVKPLLEGTVFSQYHAISKLLSKVFIFSFTSFSKGPDGSLGKSDTCIICLESQGCHLIPLFYLLSCSSACSFWMKYCSLLLIVILWGICLKFASPCHGNFPCLSIADWWQIKIKPRVHIVQNIYKQVNVGMSMWKPIDWGAFLVIQITIL